MLCDQFPDRWDQIPRDLHDGLSRVLKGSLVLCYCLCLRLLLVMGEHAADPLFVPPWRKFALFDLLPFRRRRRRYAVSGFP